jgi:hypothetical protein
MASVALSRVNDSAAGNVAAHLSYIACRVRLRTSSNSLWSLPAQAWINMNAIWAVALIVTAVTRWRGSNMKRLMNIPIYMSAIPTLRGDRVRAGALAWARGVS